MISKTLGLLACSAVLCLVASVGLAAEPGDVALRKSKATATADADVALLGVKKQSRSMKPNCKPVKKPKKAKKSARPVPEPMTMSLLGLGGAGLAYSMRRRRKHPIDIVEE